MKLKEIERELLLKGSKKEVKYILTHNGFINNTDITNGEKQLLNDLAKRLNETDNVIIIDNIAFGVYVTGYNGGYVVAGIKVSNVIK
jgi:hypothetical protein